MKKQDFTLAVDGLPSSVLYCIFFISLMIVIALNAFDNAEVTYFVLGSADSAVACRVS